MFLNDFRGVGTKAEGAKRVVILGGGTLGCLLAVQLSEVFDEVVVLEAGEKELGKLDPESFRVVGRKREGIAVGRSRSVGGTSNLWGGQLVEFQPADFAERPWMPSAAWPVSYDEVAKFFPETYRVLGIPPQFQKDQPVLAAVMPDAPKLSADTELFLTRWMPRPSMSVLFEKELTESPKIRMLTGVSVFDLKSEGGSVKSVDVRASSGEVFSVEGDVFILALGTIENSRILLATQTSDAHCPWKDNQMIGKYFQDHLGCYVGSLQPLDKKQFLRIFSNLVYQGLKYQPKLRRNSEVLEKEQLLNIQASISFDAAVAENLVFLKQFLKAAIFGRKFSNFGQFVKALVASAKYLPPLMWRYIVEHRVFVPSGGKIRLYFQCEQVPLAESAVSVDRNEILPSGLPKILLNWKVDGRELEHIKQYALELKESLQRTGLAELTLDPKLLAGSPEFLDEARDTTHQAGGLIMSDSAETGVVDKNLKVHGSTNVYAAGACVFPTSSSANTTFMALTFGMRLCEHLRSHKS